MNLGKIGSAAVTFNNVTERTPSGLAGKVAEKVIDSAVDGIVKGYGLNKVEDAVEHATATISRGAGAIASPFIGKKTKEAHQKDMQNSLEAVQGDTNKAEISKTDEK